MDERGKQLYTKGVTAPLSWSPAEKRPPVAFDDDITEDLGEDAPGRLARLTDRALNGRYYPTSIVTAWSPELERGEKVGVGTRLIKRTTLAPWLPWPAFYGLIEVRWADLTEDRFHYGYITTRLHPARGWWQVTIWREDGRLKARVQSLTIPRSLLSWIGLPIMRAIQRHARSRALAAMRSTP